MTDNRSDRADNSKRTYMTVMTDNITDRVNSTCRSDKTNRTNNSKMEYKTDNSKGTDRTDRKQIIGQTTQ